jgi:hypothetical protein
MIVFKLGDLVKIKSGSIVYKYGLIFDDKLPDVKVIVSSNNKFQIQESKIGIILKSVGSSSNRWFMIYITEETLAFWANPVSLEFVC